MGHNIKFAALVLSRYGITPENMAFDTMVAAHLLAKNLGLKALAFQKLNLEITTAFELAERGQAGFPG